MYNIRLLKYIVFATDALHVLEKGFDIITCTLLVVTMVRKRYVSISIPEELANRIDEILEGGNWGFRTRAEIVNEALREFILRLKSTQL